MPNKAATPRFDLLWATASKGGVPSADWTPAELVVFEQYRLMASTEVPNLTGAPIAWLDRARSLMPVLGLRVVIAELLQGRPSLGFARGAVRQVSYQADEVTVRLQHQPDPAGTLIWGRVSDPAFEIVLGGTSTLCSEDGDFELLVPTTDRLRSLELRRADLIVIVPMPDETE
ncbi:MAG: hypothetical protein K8R88_14220 [Armatimonadetes bacterium]|nr:hypothetical protein [Armatimonadota bacterium]